MSDSYIGGFRTLPSGEQAVANYIWDLNTLSWVVQSTTTGSGTGPVGDVFLINPSIAATQAGAWDMSILGTVPVTGPFFPEVQPISIEQELVIARPNRNAGPPLSMTVGLSSAVTVAANPLRKGCTVINLSENTISLGFDTDAILNQGITLLPFGSWSMDEYSMTTAAISAIANVAGSVLTVQEFSAWP